MAGTALDTPLPKSLLERLQAIDTPSVCNAIEVAQGHRGFAAYSRATVISSDPGALAVVGYARTSKIASRKPPEEPVDIIRARRLDYFRHMAAGPRPALAVIEDIDFPHCTGAWWGEVHTAVHKGLGLAGALTNGAMRDLGDLDDNFPVIAGSVGPSHAFVHVTEINTPVKVFDLVVQPDDLVHTDRHGAVVVPPEVFGTLEAAINTLMDSEKLILEPARQPGFGIEALEIAWTAFEKART
jgi:regulator of RNase E activity RraA